MKTIPLSQGYSAPIDDSDFDRAIVGPKWQARVHRRKDGGIKNVYAIRTVYRNGKKTTELLHRLIMGVTDPKIQIDHVNGIGTDCRRENLRIATNSENVRNQRLSVASTTGLKGVHWDKGHGKFRAQIKVNGKRKRQGRFASKYDAARAYDVASVKHHGAFGLTNAMLGLLPKRPVRITVQLTLELQA